MSTTFNYRNLVIAPHLAYRYLANDYVIIVDWKNKNTHVLRDNTARVWKKLDLGGFSGNNSIDDQACIKRLVQLGLIQSDVFKETTSCVVKEDKENAFSLINKWACKLPHFSDHSKLELFS